VLHARRYELDDAMMSGRYKAKRGKGSGIRHDPIPLPQEPFSEVVQQGTEVFSDPPLIIPRRMLFVVG